MNFKYKNILIYGYKESGKSVENILNDLNINYKIFDKNIKINGGNFLIKLNKKLLMEFDLIVLSPGISIYNKYVVLAEKLGIKVVGELEFGYWFVTCPMISVTGTNGKTSTVNMINELLQISNYKSVALGNIGKPLSSVYKQKYDFIVCEISSFQLETIDRFMSQTSILLNISPDHIDRHHTFKQYIACKKDLFKNCKNDSFALINGDNKYCLDIANSICANIIIFSKYNENADIYLKDNKVYFLDEKNSKFYIEIKKINECYIDNILAVIGVAKLLNISAENVAKVIRTKPLPHRQELVTKCDGITYINDSKATNIHACLNAINKIKGGVNLLVGGYNKKLDFNELFFKLPENVKSISVFGKARKTIASKAKKNNIQISVFKYIDNALNNAIALSAKGDTVLFSPACASFDEFNNYIERGDYFKKLVNQKINEKN